MISSNEKNKGGIIEETRKALIEDAEVPIGKKVPGSTFTIVALSYPVMLVLGTIVLAIILWLYQVMTASETEPEPTSSVAVQPFRVN